MVSPNFIILLISAVGLFLLAASCFSIHRFHKMPQFLLLGVAFFPFGTIAVLFSEGNESLFVEISVYATVVSTTFLIGFALSLLYPKLLEPQYLLFYSVIVQLAGLVAVGVTHHISASAAAWLFAPPIILLIFITLSSATWKAYKLGASQLALFCFIILVATVSGGIISIFNYKLGLGFSAYIALFGLAVARSTTQPESMAPLYREYLLLSDMKKEPGVLKIGDLSISILAFGPMGPELIMQNGELFEEGGKNGINKQQKLAHFYFVMLEPLLRNQDFIHETFGPMPAFNYPEMQSLVGAALLFSEGRNDPRLGKTIVLMILFYPTRVESLGLVKKLRESLFEYFRGIRSLEEISQETLPALRREIVARVSGIANSS